MNRRELLRSILAAPAALLAWRKAKPSARASRAGLLRMAAPIETAETGYTIFDGTGNAETYLARKGVSPEPEGPLETWVNRPPLDPPLIWHDHEVCLTDDPPDCDCAARNVQPEPGSEFSLLQLEPSRDSAEFVEFIPGGIRLRFQ